MAIPTVINETFYPTEDWNNKALSAYTVIKDALVVHFGWTVQYQDDVSADKTTVFQNVDQNFALKMVKYSVDSSYLWFEIAQSYSDINTAINPVHSGYINVSRMNSGYSIVGDGNRFYLHLAGVYSTTGGLFGHIYFFGRFNPQNPTHPAPYTAFLSYGTRFNTSKPSEYSGVSLESPAGRFYEVHNFKTGWLLYDANEEVSANSEELRIAVYSPGHSEGIYSTQVDPALDNNPLITSRSFLYQTTPGDTECKVYIGYLPGLQFISGEYNYSQFADSRQKTYDGVTYEVIRAHPEYIMALIDITNDWGT